MPKPASRPILPALAVLVACGLTACATAGAGSPPSGPAVRGLFRAGASVYPTAGSFTSRRPGWYSPAQPPSFDKTGPVAWQPVPRRTRLGAWVTRVFARRRVETTDPPTAVISAVAGLPVPSYVFVVHPQTYATVKVRVDQARPMGGALISLPRSAAEALGLEPGRAATVRVRYGEPVVAYRVRPDVRQALRPARRGEVMVAKAPEPAMPVAPNSVRAATPMAHPAVAEVAATSEPAPSRVRAYSIQAGAFADPQNARRAMEQLARLGVVGMEPTQSGRRTLYLVRVRSTDRAGAEALRKAVADRGFADARLVGPS